MYEWWASLQIFEMATATCLSVQNARDDLIVCTVEIFQDLSVEIAWDWSMPLG